RELELVPWYFLVRDHALSISHAPTWRVSFHNRITGRDRSCSYPSALKLAVLSMKYLLLTVASRPSQRAASTRMKCPLENSRTFPAMVRTRLTTRSALALICCGVSPPGQPSRKSCQS